MNLTNNIILRATTPPLFPGRHVTMAVVKTWWRGTWRYRQRLKAISLMLDANRQRILLLSRPHRFPDRIDKSVLTIAEPKRRRDKAHLRFVVSQPCLVCGRQPSDPHHLQFAQPRALGLKVSDEFTVPLCRGHHRQLHQAGNEVAWWEDLNINALEIAKSLWAKSHTKSPVKANTT
jgi:hypothetical protein